MSLLLAAGELLTAAKFNANTPYFKIKSVAQSVTSSTTMVDDADLFVDLPANRTYVVDLHVGAYGLENLGDIRMTWSMTGTVAATTRFSQGMSNPTVSDVNDTTMKISQRGGTDTVSYGTEAAGGDAAHISETLVITTGASGGRLQFRWAQQNSAATATQVTAGSFLIAVPVS